MSLGYALLHPRRLDVALEADVQKRSFDETFDLACGALGVSADLGPRLEALLQRELPGLTEVWGRFEGLLQPGKPLDMAAALGEMDLSGGFDVSASLDDLLGLLEISGSAQISDLVMPVVDALMDALPSMDHATLTASVQPRIDEIIGLLKEPVYEGRRDPAAVRAFRGAETLQCRLGPFYAAVAATAEMDPKAELRARIAAALSGLGGEQMASFQGAIRTFREQFGGLLTASASLSASFSVSVDVQTMAGSPPGLADDIQAAPHTDKSGGLWWLDLLTNVLVLFNRIWELNRTRTFKDREFEAFTNVTLVVWHLVRTVMRSFTPDVVNAPTEGASDHEKARNWFFTDQADLVLNLFVGFLNSLVYESCAFTNWALASITRWLKYLTSTFNVRLWYHMFRGLWYLQTWGAGDKSQQIPFDRLLMAVWSVVWLISALFGGLVPPWDTFAVEELGDWWAAVFLFPLLGLIVGYLIAGLVSDHNPFTFRTAPSVATFLVFVVPLLVFFIGIFGVISGLESDAQTAAFAGAGVFFGVLVVLAVLLAVGWWAGNLSTESTLGTWITQILLLLFGLLAGVLGFMSWWFIIDDGRDKHDAFADLDAERSPYRLPYREGENWFCGQGFHGIFSHTPPPFSTDLYAYDFNECPQQPTSAARTGIVVGFEQGFEDDGEDANTLRLMHFGHAEGYDPGHDQERVIHYTLYHHVSQNRVYGRLGQFMPRGTHVADIDSTGRSAQHHLHFENRTAQDGAQDLIPVVFGDSDVRGLRNYPLLAMLPGKGRIDGKPISFAFYVSENAEAPAVPSAISLATGPADVATAGGGSASHGHRFIIDRQHLDGLDAPASLTLRSTVDAGHFHTVTLEREALQRLFQLKAARASEEDDPTTDPALGHSHSLEAPDKPRAETALGMTASVTQAPAGMLRALQPAPYDVLGQRLVVRVNDRATEYYQFAGQRARHTSDIALDGGLLPGLSLDIGGTAVTTSLSGHPGLVATARELSLAFRAGPEPAIGADPLIPPAASPGPARALVARAEPVIVVESRRRGSGASLIRDAASTAPHALLPAGSGAAAAGSGAFPDLRAVSRQALADHIDAVLSAGWPSPSGAVTHAVDGDGRVELQVAGGAPDFASSAARIVRVSDALHDGTRFRATGPLPLGGGRLGLEPAYQIPILASEAQARVTPPASGTTVTARVNGIPYTFVSTSADAVGFAREIQLTVEGVRAWVDGGEVVVQSVAAGASAALSVDVGGGGSGSSGSDPDALPVGDTTAIAAVNLDGLLGDALARAGIPPELAAVNPRATLVGDVIRIEVDAPGVVSVSPAVTTGPSPLDDAVQVSPQVAELRDAPASLAFQGPGWIDVQVDSVTLRVPLDGEPARLDLALERLPESGESLQLVVDGTPVNVGFDGTDRSVAAVAARIAAASEALLVRIAHRLTLEDMYYSNDAGVVDLEDADGLALAGFLGPRPMTTPRISRAGDMLAMDANLPRNDQAPGSLVQAFTASRSGADLTLSPASDDLTLTLATSTGVDVMGLAPTPGGGLQALAVPAPVPLQGYANRYEIVVSDVDANTVAEARFQAAAEPAIARGVREMQLPPVGGSLLTIAVREGADEAQTRTGEVELAGAADADEVAARINSACPHVRAWVAKVRVQYQVEHFRPRLHVESVVGGSACELRLSPAPVALSLGFADSAVEEANDRLVFAGRGNIADGRGVTLDEMEAMLLEAQSVCTGAFLRTADTLARMSVAVRTGPDLLQLTSPEGEIELLSEPPSLAASLPVTSSPAALQIDASASLALSSGRLMFRVQDRGLAAVEIVAMPAQIRGADPLPTAPDVIDATLDRLKTSSVTLRVNGASVPLPMVPAAVTTLDAAVEFLAAQHDEVWLAIVTDDAVATDRFCVLRTHRAGSSASVAIDFQQFASGGDPFPAEGILGFMDAQLVDPTTPASWRVEGGGSGNVASIESVPVLSGAAMAPSLEDLVRAAALRGGARQASFVASAEGSGAGAVLRVAGAALTLGVSQITPPPDAPGGVDLAAVPGAAPVIEAPYVGSAPLAAGIMELRTEAAIVPGAPDDPRNVRCLFHAEPARLTLELPAQLSDLAAGALRLEVDGQVIQHVFGPPSLVPLSAASVARQLERGMQWRVLVRTLSGPDRLQIETASRGSASRLSILAAQGAPDAVTGDTGSGFAVVGSESASGSGSVPDLDAVDGDAYAQVLQAGMIAARTDSDVSHPDDDQRRATLQGSTYEAPVLDFSGWAASPPTPVLRRHAVREYAVLRSQRRGCVSSVVPLLGAEGVLAMERSLQRAPGVRASVRLPVFESVDLDGTLSIQLNENAGREGWPPEQVLNVVFEAGSYTPRQVAAVIQASLFDGGAGCAAAFPDGSIVIETQAAGIGGSVRVPAAGTGGAVASALLGDGDELFARGWPGAGRDRPSGALFPGWRSGTGNAAAGASWVFRDGDGREASVAIASGDALDDIASRLDAALATAADPSGAVAAARIGLAAVLEDGRLYVDSLTDTLVLEVDGAALGVTPRRGFGDNFGATRDRDDEPAVQLRGTHEVRTCRLLRDRMGKGVAAERDDFGWVRLPTDGDGAPIGIDEMPGGLYLVEARVDAARFDDDPDSAAMLIDGGSDAGDPQRHFATRVRYWVLPEHSVLMAMEVHGEDPRVAVAYERRQRP